jgi:hypothetical protein
MIDFRMLLAGSLLGLLVPTLAGAQTTPPDLREFRVGMKLAALPQHGYTDFHCAAAPSGTLDGWADYRKCPTDAAGQQEVTFRYDDGGEHETKVAGQPVLLSLVFTPDGTVHAIRMRTDPSARLFLRKRGYIFGEQVMAHYGDAGWSCSEAPPSGGQEPVGGIFVHEHCEKSIDTRHLVVERELYRGLNQSPAAFTSATEFTVSLARPSQG